MEHVEVFVVGRRGWERWGEVGRAVAGEVGGGGGGAVAGGGRGGAVAGEGREGRVVPEGGGACQLCRQHNDNSQAIYIQRL